HLAEELERQGFMVSHIILQDGPHGGPVCDDHTLAFLQNKLPQCNGYLAVGAGVVNDLTKWLSCERGSFYAVCATAATMNGYTAANVAATLDGVKSLVVSHAPLAVFADPAIIAGAPHELTAAGLGDVLAKPISTADWLMNHHLLDEYFCPFCARMINDLEPTYMEHPAQIKEHAGPAIKGLFDALLYSGIAMTMVGTSAPASGGEHMLSHTLDMMAMVDGAPHDLHGRQVGVTVIFTAALYERLFAMDQFKIRLLPAAIDRGFWGRLADPVERQYREKLPLLERMAGHIRMRTPAWTAFLQSSREQVRPPATIKHCLKTAGAAHTWSDLGCSRERFLAAARHMHEIRKRPTIVDLAWLLGILPDAAESITDQWLTT
ncbi:MAG: iron-containing alcohol dehydrogenase, partial [Kiritimatiellia bacterium]|nr:iron-containing alcohol dehydrogenase [Lentisphaerota bacterium]